MKTYLKVMKTDLKAEKADLRARCLRLRRRFTEIEVFQASAAIRRRLLELRDFREADVVHTYVSKNDEIDTTEVILMTLGSGRRVVVPVVEKGRRNLRHAEVNNLEELVPGPFGLLQPPVETARWIEEDIYDLILVPGVAFDACGRRIGYGRGYYDRFLAGVGALRVGLVQAPFLVDAVPVEPHDVTVNVVLTETETYKREPR